MRGYFLLYIFLSVLISSFFSKCVGVYSIEMNGKYIFKRLLVVFEEPLDCEYCLSVGVLGHIVVQLSFNAHEDKYVLLFLFIQRFFWFSNLIGLQYRHRNHFIPQRKCHGR